jgi:hypothetical protein
VYAATSNTLGDGWNVNAMFKELGAIKQAQSPTGGMARIFASINRDQLSADIFDKGAK